MKYGLLYTVSIFLLCGSIGAQTTLNPDISAVGEISGFTHNDLERRNENEQFNLSNPNLEINLNGYLNPYARADAVIAWEGDENAVIEEFYATILRGLPLNMNLRAGKYLLEFGRLNPIHTHAWSFIERPLVHEAFFGDEGLNDAALRTAFLLPTGNAYTELMAAVTRGHALLEEDALEGNDTTHINPGFFGRLTTSFATSDIAEFALGTSVLSSVHEFDQEQLQTFLLGIDAKYKAKGSRYSTLLIEAEGLYRSQKQDSADNISSYGGYAYLDYRFRQKYNVGGMFDYTSLKSIEVDTSGTPSEVTSNTWRGALFVGFAPIEETSLVRLVGHWTKPEHVDGIWELTMQFVYSLGPHKPHNF